MKVLPTLGSCGGNQVGVFQYRRTPDGVNIDASIGQANLPKENIWITSDEWMSILSALAKAPKETFRLTPPSASNATEQPTQNLHDLIKVALPYPADGWPWHDSYLAYICAILHHEGSIEHYHGPMGPGVSSKIVLIRDLA